MSGRSLRTKRMTLAIMRRMMSFAMFRPLAKMEGECLVVGIEDTVDTHKIV